MRCAHASFVAALNMTENSTASGSIDWTALPAGRHHHRFGDATLGFNAWIWRGKPGPTLVINGATHGDEYEGPTLLRKWVDAWHPADLHGTVVLVPVLNEGAFGAGLRCHPIDGGNLARAFPGKTDGSPTAQLAHLFDTALLAQATHYVDLHSGGHAFEIHPWVGYIGGGGAELDTIQHAMAACFDTLWGWSGPFLPGRSLSAAFERKIPAIYTESHGAGDVLPADLAALDRGLQNLLIAIGCLDGPPPALAAQPFHQSINAEETHLQVHHPAPHAGIFEPAVALRDHVKVGANLGVVWPFSDGPPTPIFAETTGTVVLRRHQRSVQPDDALFVVVSL